MSNNLGDSQGDFIQLNSGLLREVSPPHHVMSFLKTKSANDLEQINVHHRLDRFGLLSHGAQEHDLKAESLKWKGKRGCCWKMVSILTGEFVQGIILFLIIANLVLSSATRLQTQVIRTFDKTCCACQAPCPVSAKPGVFVNAPKFSPKNLA